MECPTCRSWNPDRAASCACGYQFSQHLPEKAFSERKRLASLGSRLLGQLLDDVVLIGIMLATAILGDRMGLSVPLGLILVPAYLLFSDGLHGGQSLGKRPLKTAVIDATTGAPCTYWKSFVRNIFLVLGIIDWIFILGDKRQRLGDMVANTIVIDRS